MNITITLIPEKEARLLAKAAREGCDVQSAALHTLDDALLSDAQDYAEAVEGIRHGLHDFAEGRFRPFAEFEAEQRVKHNLMKTTNKERTVF